MNSVNTPPPRSHLGYDLAVFLTLLLLLLLLFVLPRDNCCAADGTTSAPAMTASESPAPAVEQEAPAQPAMPASDTMPASDSQAVLDQETAWPGCEAILSASYIAFESGSGRLTEKGARLLDRLIFCLGDGDYLIVGHTDSQGDPESNMILSRLRAEAVKAYLIDKGIPAERLSTQGAGETDPIASNATEDGRARNRRIEFIQQP